ncbi:hypothetical protein [Microcella sp.]|uniref:hypothetical protein n=1 Tax=Microcella sp. TaxID=1913979 RepID=UPI0025672EFE|nr:hypothetical protein [Microcella sp.]MBX9470777.1 hypothetical protein [Microcella sp.]
MTKSWPITVLAIVVCLAGIALILALRLFLVGASTAPEIAVVVGSGLFLVGVHGLAVYWLIRPVSWALIVTTVLGLWAVADLLGGLAWDSIASAVLGVVVITLSWFPNVRAHVKPAAAE